jgi:hypothetical protein
MSLGVVAGRACAVNWLAVIFVYFRAQKTCFVHRTQDIGQVRVARCVSTAAESSGMGLVWA